MRLPTQLFGNSLETLESPFLDEEIASRSTAVARDESRPDGERALDVSYGGTSDAARFRPEAFEPESVTDEADVAAEDEILNVDNRAVVANTLSTPHRWICAIDIVTRNPDWPKSGSMHQIKSRATGILIGPRYVLTAFHILGNLDANDKLKDVHSLKISPARNGSNSNNPFGAIESTRICVPPVRDVEFTVGQGSQRATVKLRQRDDYALIILPRDIDSLTHKSMQGKLGFWGSDPAVSAIKRLDVADINGKSGTVTGYPGDTCDKTILTGTPAVKERRITDCWRRRNDEWASRQWTDSGNMQVPSDIRLVHHAADTFEGDSGAPIYFNSGNILQLVGVHSGPENNQFNKGFRVTRRMLNDLRDWINADAGSTVVEVRNDMLVFMTATSRNAGAGAKEREDYEAFEFEDGEWDGEVVREELFDPASVPADVTEALGKPDVPLALARALAAGWHDENELTNLVFFAKHKELTPGPLDAKAPNFKKLADEWTKILKTQVRVAIQKATANTDLAVSGYYVSERDHLFLGSQGTKFKELVEWAAAEVDLNPGLLAAIALAEWDQPSLYLQAGEVSSFQAGSDDFFASRAKLAENVPAFAKVKFNGKQVSTDINEQQRLVTTVLFSSGKDALLGTAVYAKNGEIKLRKGAETNGGDFDKLPIETRFALVRIAMAAGHGGIAWNGDFTWFKKKDDKWMTVKAGTPGATLLGVAWTLHRVLNGHDILIRKNEPRGDPSKSGRVTHRNATILAAQALHLSDWIFGKPLQAQPGAVKAQPELELFGHLLDVRMEGEDFGGAEDQLDEESLAYEGVGK